MSGAWSHRVVKDDKGKLHFACVRFRPEENTISGTTEPWNIADDIESLRQLARELLQACDRGVIDLATGIDPDADEDEDDGLTDWERDRNAAALQDWEDEQRGGS